MILFFVQKPSPNLNVMFIFILSFVSGVHSVAILIFVVGLLFSILFFCDLMMKNTDLSYYIIAFPFQIKWRKIAVNRLIVDSVYEPFYYILVKLYYFKFLF